MQEPYLVRCARCDALVHYYRWERCRDCQSGVLCPYCIKHHEALGHSIQVTLETARAVDW